jgi:glycosyltransferase involved in cell wall biosynthesis
MFLELKAERIEPIYRFLKRHNRKVFLCAHGMDTYWVKACTRKPYIFRYSDFNVGNRATENEYTLEQIKDWIDTPKEKLNRYIANDCNGIIAGMYEYHTAYTQEHADKLTYIPLPAEETNRKGIELYHTDRKLRFFIGIQKSRSIYKGTDIMLRALERIHKDYPDKCEILRAENVPFAEYSRMINSCDVLLDQLYGYSPGMNALLAMSKGKIVVGGAEEECYRILDEETLRPMINVVPDEEDVYNKLRWLVEKKEQIATLQQESIEFIEKHHSPRKVAEQYIAFWNSKL